MTNYSKTTMMRVGRLMSTGEPNETPPLVKLAKAGAFGRKAIYNWSLPETDAQHRTMPPSAKRMVAMLAYFSAAGLLTDRRLEDIMALEATFENEKDTNVLLRRMKRLISGPAKPKAAEGEADVEGELDETGHEGAFDEGHVFAANAEHVTPRAA